MTIILNMFKKGSLGPANGRFGMGCFAETRSAHLGTNQIGCILDLGVVDVSRYPQLN
jgi:hypothetical protein